MRRKKRGKSAPPVRVPDEVTSLVNELTSRTGWSATRALTFLATAGWNAATAKGDKTASYRTLLSAAVEHHDAELNARKKLAATSAKLREAGKALLPSKSRR